VTIPVKFPDKVCKYCQRKFNRKRFRSAKLGSRIESAEEYSVRIFCDRECYMSWNRGPNHHQYKDGRSAPSAY
jgi:hypothetical protein